MRLERAPIALVAVTITVALLVALPIDWLLLCIRERFFFYPVAMGQNLALAAFWASPLLITAGALQSNVRGRVALVFGIFAALSPVWLFLLFIFGFFSDSVLNWFAYSVVSAVLISAAMLAGAALAQARSIRRLVTRKWAQAHS